MNIFCKSYMIPDFKHFGVNKITGRSLVIQYHPLDASPYNTKSFFWGTLKGQMSFVTPLYVTTVCPMKQHSTLIFQWYEHQVLFINLIFPEFSNNNWTLFWGMGYRSVMAQKDDFSTRYSSFLLCFFTWCATKIERDV